MQIRLGRDFLCATLKNLGREGLGTRLVASGSGGWLVGDSEFIDV